MTTTITKPDDRGWRDHVLLIGEPGSGMLEWAREQRTAVPIREWSTRESDSEYIFRIAGLGDQWRERHSLLKGPPLRAPHHTVSIGGLTGKVAKGWQVRPGEVSLAHGGLLLLDEANEFSHAALAMLVAITKKGAVRMSWSSGPSFDIPAEFRLIAMGRPCPCGYRGTRESDPRGMRCTCTDVAVERYQRYYDPLREICRVVPVAEWQAELEAIRKRQSPVVIDQSVRIVVAFGNGVRGAARQYRRGVPLAVIERLALHLQHGNSVEMAEFAGMRAHALSLQGLDGEKPLAGMLERFGLSLDELVAMVGEP